MALHAWRPVLPTNWPQCWQIQLQTCSQYWGQSYTLWVHINKQDGGSHKIKGLHQCFMNGGAIVGGNWVKFAIWASCYCYVGKWNLVMPGMYELASKTIRPTSALTFFPSKLQQIHASTANPLPSQWQEVFKYWLTHFPGWCLFKLGCAVSTQQREASRNACGSSRNMIGISMQSGFQCVMDLCDANKMKTPTTKQALVVFSLKSWHVPGWQKLLGLVRTTIWRAKLNLNTMQFFPQKRREGPKVSVCCARVRVCILQALKLIFYSTRKKHLGSCVFSFLAFWWLT